MKKGESLQQVAEAVSASKTHIWDLESGRSTNPSIELLTRIANHFQVRIADLAGGDPEAEDADPVLVAMYRELKELTPKDRETIRVLIKQLKWAEANDH